MSAAERTVPGRPRVSVVILPDLPWRDAAERWKRAEAYGFRIAWTYDHLAWRSLADGPWFGAVPTLAAAATVTGTIRLGTLVASPNFRHPVPFAKELMTLDDISDGRCVLGVGAGGTGFDARVLGDDVLPAGRRVDRFSEFVALLDRLLCRPATSSAGEWYHAVDARMVPGCVQRPRLPFVVAANGPRTLALAARHGQGWVTTGRSEPAGDPDAEAAWWRGIAELAARFDDELAAAAHPDPASVERHLLADVAGDLALSSVERFQDVLGRAGELGLTDVAVHWPRPHGVYAGSERILDEVAPLIQR